MKGFRIPDFALGGLIAAVLATLAVLSAFPNNFGDPVVWIPLLGFVLAVAISAWIIGNPQRKDFATLLVLGLTGLIIAMQFAAQRAQVDEMRSEQRAWVSISTIKVYNATRDSNGLTLYIRYSVENSGKNPASNVHLNPKLYIYGSQQEIH